VIVPGPAARHHGFHEGARSDRPGDVRAVFLPIPSLFFHFLSREEKILSSDEGILVKQLFHFPLRFI
jgi:hypothetical protein